MEMLGPIFHEIRRSVGGENHRYQPPIVTLLMAVFLLMFRCQVGPFEPYAWLSIFYLGSVFLIFYIFCPNSLAQISRPAYVKFVNISSYPNIYFL